MSLTRQTSPEAMQRQIRSPLRDERSLSFLAERKRGGSAMVSLSRGCAAKAFVERKTEQDASAHRGRTGRLTGGEQSQFRRTAKVWWLRPLSDGHLRVAVF